MIVAIPAVILAFCIAATGTALPFAIVFTCLWLYTVLWGDGVGFLGLASVAFGSACWLSLLM